MKENTPLLGGVLIILGVFLAGYAVVRMVQVVRIEESPFDQLDTEEQGFLPSVVRSEEEEPAPDLPAAARFERDPGVEETLQAQLTPGTGSLEAAAQPDTTALPEYIPDRIVIPDIALDAPVIEATTRQIEYLDESFEQWLAPDEFAAGWHMTSAPLGVPGNTVINGHHNVHGEVFRYLEDLELGDRIWVYSGSRVFLYQIAAREILKERWQPVEVRLENARWLQTSDDERLTLVTCWPYESNTHRLIIAARPVRSYEVQERDLD